MAEPWFDVREMFGPQPPTFPGRDPIWGPLRDGSVDWSAPLQAAIDWLIERSEPGKGTLYLPPGRYRISRPLMIARTDGHRYLPCTLTIVGDCASGFDAFHASCICTDFNDAPAIIIQAGRDVQLRRLVIQGKNNWFFAINGRRDAFDADTTDLGSHLREELEGVDPYLQQNNDAGLGIPRDRPASPHAGVCIDPFHPKVPKDEQYVIRPPGPLPAPLRGPGRGVSLRDPFPFPRPRTPHPGASPGDMIVGETPDSDRYLWGPESRGIVLDDCNIFHFVVGVCVAPAGRVFDEPGGPETTLTLRTSTVTITKSCLSVSGPRKVELYSAGLGKARHCIDCLGYAGQGPGELPLWAGRCPSIYGANIGATKYIFRTGNTGASASLSGIYAEAILSLGQLGTPPEAAEEVPDRYSFQACTFNFPIPQQADQESFKRPPLPSIHAHLVNFAHTRMTGCQLVPIRGSDDNAKGPCEPIHLINGGDLHLESCFLGGIRGVFDGAPGKPEQNPDYGPQFWISGQMERVTLRDCLTQDTRDPGTGRVSIPMVLSSDQKGVPSFQGFPYLQAQTLPGALYYYDEFLAFLDEERFLEPKYPPLRQAGGQWPLIPLGRFTVGPMASQIQLGLRTALYQGENKARPDGTLTFQAEDGIVLVGDVLVARQVVDEQERDWDGALVAGAKGAASGSGPLLLGRVVDVGATMGTGAAARQQVTVHFLPARLAPILRTPPSGLTLALYIAYFPRIHPPTLANLTVNDNVVRNARTRPDNTATMPPTPFTSVETGWARGQRIFAVGFPLGAYIESINTIAGLTEISLSKRAVLTKDDVLFKDADMTGFGMFPITSTIYR